MSLRHFSASSALAAVRKLLRPPRRLRVLRPGGFMIFGTFALGLASLNTGNNLLYLLMGALLGTIVLSGWLSEQALRGIRVRRHLPRALTAGEPGRIRYDVHNTKTRLPSHGLELRETRAQLTTTRPAVALVLEASATAHVHAEVTAPRRGIHHLDELILATAFPFGLFAKERDVPLGGTLIVWPRTDRAVRAHRFAGRRGARIEAGSLAAAGAARGDYRGLRDYRAGDDPRDVHWRSTARRGTPTVREYEGEAGDEYWIVLDDVAPTDADGEAAIEAAASLAADALRRGDRFGFAAGTHRLPARSLVRIDTLLDLLATLEVARTGHAPVAPAAPSGCVLVTARDVGGDWGDVIRVSAEDGDVA